MRKIPVPTFEIVTGELIVFNYGELARPSQIKAIQDYRKENGEHLTANHIKAEFHAYSYEFTSEGYYAPPFEKQEQGGFKPFKTVSEAIDYVKASLLNFTKEKLSLVIDSIKNHGIYINKTTMIVVDPDGVLGDDHPLSEKNPDYRLN